MQQYFTNETLIIGNVYQLDQEALYHSRKVLRKDDGYLFRMVDNNHDIYEVELRGNSYKVLSKLNEDNELDVKITVIMSLIKNDKFDLTIQKLCELGVSKIVPYVANRSVVKPTNIKKLDRLEKIAREAAEQSHRNIIPEIGEYCFLKDLPKYLSKHNYVAYEKNNEPFDYKNFKSDDSVTIIIGPEGGFEEKEIEAFENLGFTSITLGHRILRAETAAMFLTSLIVRDHL